MKRSLLATSAMALALCAVPAAQSHAAERIQISVGGFMEQWFGFATNNDNTDATHFDVQSDSEIIFEGSTTLDNGIQFGVVVELEANNSGDQIDQSYLWMEAPFGRIEIGDADNAAALMHYTAPDVGIGLNDGDQFNWVVNGTGSAGTTFISTFLYVTEDASTKITYFTPRIAGFQLGVSYAPELTQDRNAMPTNINYENGFWGGLNYVRSFNDVSVAIAVGGTYIGQEPNNATAPGAEDLWGVSTGFNIGYAGFTLGGSFAYTSGFTGQTAAGVGVDAEGIGFDIGLAYETGPAAVSIAWYHGREEGNVFGAGGGIDFHNTVMLSGSYTIGPGIDAKGSAFYVDQHSDGSGNSNDGFGIVGGFALTF